MPKIENKEKTLFWLKRRERQLSSMTLDHAALANAQLPYAERRKIVAEHEFLAESVRAEVESLQAAIRFIEENADG